MKEMRENHSSCSMRRIGREPIFGQIYVKTLVEFDGPQIGLPGGTESFIYSLTNNQSGSVASWSVVVLHATSRVVKNVSQEFDSFLYYFYLRLKTFICILFDYL